MVRNNLSKILCLHIVFAQCGEKIGESNMTLEEKLRLWVKITGIDPSVNQTYYTIHFDGSLSSWDIEKVNYP